MVKNIKKQDLIIMAVALVITCLLGFLEVVDKSQNIATTELYPLDEMTNTTVYTQTVFINEDIHLEELEIMFATHNRINTNTVSFKVYVNGEIATYGELEAEHIPDNELYLLFFKDEGMQLYKGDEFKIEISSQDAKEGNTIAIWANRRHTNEGDSLTMMQDENETLLEGGIIMNMTDNTTLLNSLINRYNNYVLMIPIIIISAFIIIFLTLKLGYNLIKDVLKK